MTNIGPKVSFIDPDQADPQPTNLTFGFAYEATLVGEQDVIPTFYSGKVDISMVNRWDSPK